MARACAVAMAVLTLGACLPAAGESASAPKLLHKTDPQYTPQANRAGVQGTVVLAVRVDESGKVAESTVLSPIGFGLEDRARQCVAQWRFQPALENGRAVSAWTTVEVNFRLFHRVFNSTLEDRRTAYNLAVDAIQSHRRTQATLDTIRDLAEQHYPPAMYLYARMLHSGDGYMQDQDLALRMLTDAAQKNYPAAVFEMGRLQIEGKRVPQDLETGFGMVKRAAVLGNRQAEFFLAMAYLKGDVIPHNPDRARQYFRLCATQGDTPCQVHLAQLLLNSPQRTEREYLQALAWLNLAASAGDPQARALLEPEQSKLTPEQVSWVGRLKDQIGHTP